MLGGLLGRRRRAARRAGDRARDRRDWVAAAAGYRRWLGAHPRDAAIWIQLGHALAESGRLEEADTAYRRAEALTPDDADLAMCRGHLAKRRGRTGEALDLYRRSLALGGGEAASNEVAGLLPSLGGGGSGAIAVSSDAPVRLEGWCDRLISGSVAADQPETMRLVFRANGHIVGRARPVGLRADGRRPFRTFLDIKSSPEGVKVTAEADGRAVEGSPVVLNPSLEHVEAPAAWTPRAEIVKPPRVGPGREVALFVTHSPTGAIKPHVLPHIAALAAEGVATVLVVTTDRPVALRPELVEAVDGLLVRENRGWDFAAWAHALYLWPELWSAGTLYLVNDSIFGPAEGTLGPMLARVRQSAAALVGLTESHEYGWHLQSYFLAMKAPLLGSWVAQELFGDVRIIDDKDAVIRFYETQLAPKVEAAGLGVETLFPSAAAINPTLFDWRGLIAAGFPYVKAHLLKGTFPQVDTDGWRAVLAASGFDLDVIDAGLLPTPVPPQPRDDRLLARKVEVEGGPAAGSPRVALYGPWNYDNGLGGASRNLIGALRRAGVRLSLHPIEKPFHVHKPLAPPVPIRDFAGPADVAIVHLNPDSWHLLTDEQRAEVKAARRRIGYWVWEMEELPEAWSADFASVDRIWSPSRWCAGVFARNADVGVDVIPHPVPLAGPPAIDRATVLGGLGLPGDAKLILYVFDGSSYLVRKNPHALVRAFAASGLAARGWRLVLKTKHLMDRPKDGAAFQALAERTDGVTLIDRGMAEGELAALMAACDIYASPHCAEGFGLTVSEALAAGKAVVATDYSGTADMLDATTGWPVRAEPWTLTEDFGHYRAGFTWARVDEAALAEALADAAGAVERGDRSRPEAGRARVAERLSNDGVGRAIADSLRAVAEEKRQPDIYPSRGTDLAVGLPFTEADLGPGVRAVALPLAGPVEADGNGWLAFAPGDSIVSPWFPRTLHRAILTRPDAAIFYGDDFAREGPSLDQVRLKPAFDPLLLAAQDQIGAPVIIRAALFRALGGLGDGIDDLLFRAHAAGHSIVRLPEVLLTHPGLRPRAMAEERRAVVARAFPAFDVRPGQTPALLELHRRWQGDEPPVTIVVPTRRSPAGDGRPHVAHLLDALDRVDWPRDRLTVIVGDDVEGPADWAAGRPYRVEHLPTPRGPDEPFNYAAKMNRLWRAATTEQIVLMNDDVLPGDPGWLRALIGLSMDGKVGGVAPRLDYPDGRLQHAGVMPFQGRVAHAWLGRRRMADTYQDWGLSQRAWSMVTGAVFATRRAALEAVDGFDERFTLEFNDIDLCLRLRTLGLSILYNPAARMTHAEKASRGEEPPHPEEMALFGMRWRTWLRDDPAWHPLLDTHRLDVAPVYEREAWYG